VKLETVWTVTDPLATSELGDVCWECTPQDLAYAIIGDHVGSGRSFAGLTLYTTEAEARADAEERLRKLDAAKPLEVHDENGSVFATLWPVGDGWYAWRLVGGLECHATSEASARKLIAGRMRDRDGRTA
jgi:hypothetical protein